MSSFTRVAVAMSSLHSKRNLKKDEVKNGIFLSWLPGVNEGLLNEKIHPKKENASVSGKDMKKAEALGRQNMLVLMSAV